MKNQNYSISFEVPFPPKVVFTHVNDVSKWWSQAASEAASGWKTEFKPFEGQSTKLNDEFILRSGDQHYSKHKLIEVIPNKKVVWLVTESKLNWIKKNKGEWTNTKMIFEITPKGDRTLLNFTHEGLVPELECYSMCVQGWNILIKERLYSFITDGGVKSNI